MKKSPLILILLFLPVLLSISCRHGVVSPYDLPAGSVISGVVFYDKNHNGLQDSSETGIPGWKIVLEGSKSGTVFTDANGKYQFQGLDSGSYFVVERIP